MTLPIAFAGNKRYSGLWRWAVDCPWNSEANENTWEQNFFYLLQALSS